MPVLFNVFEHWNEESVVHHISFDSIRTQMADLQVPSMNDCSSELTSIVARRVYCTTYNTGLALQIV